ncbi:unnamed protein product [Phytophthora lilii]|uniref:Unnamed protein product n=1 Tax=Phytophthora lilii TaxID=2077276 RepID=A0A9W6WXL5_9STRA|nr:unnamed protein product [Phytophthora lilii]
MITPNKKQVLPTMNMALEFGESDIPVPAPRPTLKKEGSGSSSSTVKSIAMSKLRPATGLDVLTSDEHYRLLKKRCRFCFSPSWYLTILYYLPNRQFYPQLADLTDDELWGMVTSVLAYGTLELGSLAVLVGVLRRIVHHRPLQQQAFVREREFLMVQTKLVLWVTMTLQATLPHLGADYTFKFEWLHNKNAV